MHGKILQWNRRRSYAAGIFLCVFIILGIKPLFTLDENNSDYLFKLDPHLQPFYHYSLLKSADLLNEYERSWIDEGQYLRAILRTNKSAQEIESLGIQVSSQTGSVVTCRIPLGVLPEILSSPAIDYIHHITIHKPMLDSVVKNIRLDQKPQTNPLLNGAGIIIGIYDTGIDWHHQDFRLDNGQTRILTLWDQTSSTGPAPSGYTYGREYTKAQLNDELDGTPAGIVKEKDSYGHGTHVASIAGGNGSATGNGYPAGRYTGIAPEVEFIIVKGGDSTFSSDREIDGMNYIFNRARALNRPVVVNLSLGGHEGAHDGTDPTETAIDNITGPGKIVVSAAGNDGNNNIHFEYRFIQQTTFSVQFNVPSYTPKTGNKNDYINIEAWYSGSNPPSVTLKTPGGLTIGPIPKGTRYDSSPDGYISISNAPNGKLFINNAYEINITITDDRADIIPKTGTWILQFQTNSGDLDGWIGDSSMDAKLSDGSSVHSKVISIPGTSRQVITVGSYKSKMYWTGFDSHQYSTDIISIGALSTFSSVGPTRDGRLKPDISAPGQEVTAAKSQDYNLYHTAVDPDGVHTTFRGTSMAAPVITGLVALMLQKNPLLTPDQAKSLLLDNAKKDEFTGAVWNESWGYGKVDAKATLDKMVVSDIENNQNNVVPTSFSLEQNYPNPFNSGTMIKFTIPMDAEVALVIYNIPGEEITTLADRLFTAGEHTIFWDGKNSVGNPAASGIYICRLKTRRFYKSIKMVLLR